MSNPQELLQRLRSNGITVALNGGNLRLSPPEKIDAEIVDAVREHKPGLIQVLKAEVGECDRMVSTHIETVNQVFPPDAVVKDWTIIDQLDAQVAHAKDRLDLGGLKTILEDYQRHVQHAYGCEGKKGDSQ